MISICYSNSESDESIDLEHGICSELVADYSGLFRLQNVTLESNLILQ